MCEGFWQPSPRATPCPSPSSGAPPPALPLHEVVLLLLLSVVERLGPNPTFLGYEFLTTVARPFVWRLWPTKTSCYSLLKRISRWPISSSSTASAWFALVPFGCGEIGLFPRPWYRGYRASYRASSCLKVFGSQALMLHLAQVHHEVPHLQLYHYMRLFCSCCLRLWRDGRHTPISATAAREIGCLEVVDSQTG